MSLGGILGAIVGGVIGFYTGGPVGALKGIMIGYTIGAGVDMLVNPYVPDRPSPGQPDTSSLSINSIEEGGSIIDALGTTKISRANFIWMGRNRSEALEETVEYEVPSGCGSKKKSETYTTGYRYYLTWALGICVGPIDEVVAILKDDDQLIWAGSITSTSTINIKDVGSADFYFGEDSQPINTNIASYNYKGLAYVYFDDCFIGEYNRGFIAKFIIRKTPSFSFNSHNRIGAYDYNPAHALWYILTEMVGLEEDYLDDASFSAVADTLYNEGIGIGISFTDQVTAETYIESILGHISGMLVYGNNSRLHLKLMRKDVLIENLPVVTENMLLEEPEINRTGWGETINELKIQFINKYFVGGKHEGKLHKLCNVVPDDYPHGWDQFTLGGDYLIVTGGHYETWGWRAYHIDSHGNMLFADSNVNTGPYYGPRISYDGRYFYVVYAGVGNSTVFSYLPNNEGKFIKIKESSVKTGVKACSDRLFVTCSSSIYVYMTSHGGELIYLSNSYCGMPSAKNAVLRDNLLVVQSSSQIKLFSYEQSISGHIYMYEFIEQDDITVANASTIDVSEDGEFLFVSTDTSLLSYKIDNYQATLVSSTGSQSRNVYFGYGDILYDVCTNVKTYSVASDASLTFIEETDFPTSVYGSNIVGNKDVLYTEGWGNSVHSYRLSSTVTNFVDAILNLKDCANIQAEEKTNPVTMKLGLISDEIAIAKVGDTILERGSYPKAILKLNTNRDTFLLDVGDAFVLNYEPYGISNAVYRVIGMTEENLLLNTINIEAIEDILYLSNTLSSSYISAGGTGGTGGTGYNYYGVIDYIPTVVDKYCIEAPYVVSGESLTTMFIAVKTGSITAFKVYSLADEEDSEYINILLANIFTPVGWLNCDYTSDTRVIDSEVGFTVTFYPDSNISTMETVSRTSLFSDVNTMMIGDEIISFQTMVPNVDGGYDFTNIVRGRYDTKVADHSSGDSVIFLGNKLFNLYSGTQLILNENRTYRYTSVIGRDESPLTTVNDLTFTPVGRAFTPYFPSSPKGNGSGVRAKYTGDIVLTWRARVRGDSYVDFNSTSPATHEGMFKIEVYVSTVLVRTATAIDTVTWTYSEANNISDNGSLASSVEFKIYNYIDNTGSTYTSTYSELIVEKS